MRAIIVLAALTLGASSAWAELVDDPYHPATKIPCAQQLFPPKAECPIAHDAFMRRWKAHKPFKRDRLRELEDRVQELEMRLQQGR